MRYLLMLLLVFSVAVTTTGCTKTYYVETGLPADVAGNFFFHLQKEAESRGLNAQRTDMDLHVYSEGNQIWYQIQDEEIIASIVIPQRSSANENWYAQKKRELQRLHDELMEGARKRSVSAQDFQ